MAIPQEVGKNAERDITILVEEAWDLTKQPTIQEVNSNSRGEIIQKYYRYARSSLGSYPISTADERSSRVAALTYDALMNHTSDAEKEDTAKHTLFNAYCKAYDVNKSFAFVERCIENTLTWALVVTQNTGIVEDIKQLQKDIENFGKLTTQAREEAKAHIEHPGIANPSRWTYQSEANKAIVDKKAVELRALIKELGEKNQGINPTVGKPSAPNNQSMSPK